MFAFLFISYYMSRSLRVRHLFSAAESVRELLLSQWSLCVVASQRATMCIWQAAMLIHTWVKAHVTLWVFLGCTYLCGVCVRVNVSPCRSLLIRYGDVSMLQACMIKRSGLNVKPYRDEGKQSRKLSWQSCVRVPLLWAWRECCLNALAFH